jgi:hypothetical protein
MVRFSRRLIADTIAARIERLETENTVKFDNSNGWAQVHGKGEVVSRAYGAWEALNSLMDDLGLWQEVEEADRERKSQQGK